MWVFTKTLSGRFHFFFAEKKVIIRRIFAENNTYNCRKVLSAEHKAAVVETPGGHAVDESSCIVRRRSASTLSLRP